MPAPAPRLRLRLTIGQMMAVVIILAVIFASSAGAPRAIGLAGVMIGFLMNVGALAMAMLGVIYREGPARGFWLGFAGFEGPPFAFLMYLLSAGPGPDDLLIAMLLGGVLPFAWIGGTIGKQFAAAAEPPAPPE